MFGKTLAKLSRSWQEKYLKNTAQAMEYYRQFQDVDYEWDVPFKSKDGTSLLMDMFRPKGFSLSNCPAVLMVHGGGFFMGDRKMDLGLCRHFAKAGFVASSIEYRLFPEVDVRGVIADVIGGIEALRPDYIVASSAGVFAAILAIRETSIKIRAIASLSGMFYSRRKDLVGLAMSNIVPKNFADTESDEVVDSLPPMFLVTSKGDFLKKYTLRYADFLTRRGKVFELANYYKSKHLVHSFPSLMPEAPESIEVDTKIAEWFRRL